MPPRKAWHAHPRPQHRRRGHARRMLRRLHAGLQRAHLPARLDRRDLAQRQPRHSVLPQRRPGAARRVRLRRHRRRSDHRHHHARGACRARSLSRHRGHRHGRRDRRRDGRGGGRLCQDHERSRWPPSSPAAPRPRARRWATPAPSSWATREATPPSARRWKPPAWWWSIRLRKSPRRLPRASVPDVPAAKQPPAGRSNARSYATEDRFPRHVLNKKWDGRASIKVFHKDLRSAVEFCDQLGADDNLTRATLAFLSAQ